ncbi:MAG: hypothetical protein CR986_06965 [Ignavibacteriae bacterium]|nr:MAG: hypothetical protein CR986_06965 [Ignavibacteriota bacterium]
MKLKKFISIILFFLSYQIFGQSSNITVTSPSENDIVSAGSKYMITWSSINVFNLNIKYSLDNGNTWKIISHSVSAIKRQFLWDIPSNLEGNISIKLSSLENENIFFLVKNVLIKNNQNKSGRNKSLIKELHKSKTSLLRIMPLGNSITRGIIESATNTGYRKYLSDLLLNEGVDFDFVGSQVDGTIEFDKDHEGHGGWSAASNVNRSKSLVDSVYRFLTNNPPNIILLHIGTNDIGTFQVLNENVTDLVDEVSAILDSIDRFEQENSLTITVLLAQIIQQVDDPATIFVNERDSVIAFNLALESMVNSRISNGDKIVLVNQESALNYPTDLSDGVHPNEIGYQKMANRWFYSLINNILPKITQNPVAKGGVEGDTVTYKIEVESKSPVTYQWRKNGVNIFGATSSSYTVTNIAAGDSLNKYSCEVKNDYGRVISKEADLYCTPFDERVKGGEITSYTFEEKSGSVIYDKANTSFPLKLRIYTPYAVDWSNTSLEIVQGANIISNRYAENVINKCKATNELTVEMWIIPANNTQTGPARIVTLSENASNRDFGIFQDGSEYIFRLRTTNTDNNGESSTASFTSQQDSLLHIACTRSNNGGTKIFINGIEKKNSSIIGDFSNWASNYYLSLANEIVDSKPWLGKFYLFSIYNRALSSNEIMHNYSIKVPATSNLSPPTDLISESIADTSVYLEWIDNNTTEIGFIIEKSIGNNFSFFQYDTTLTDINNYFDKNAKQGIRYFYKVKSFNEFITSGYSNESEIMLPLKSPSSLTAVTDNNNNIVLNWRDNSLGESTFIIEGKADHPDSSYHFIDSVDANATTYIDKFPKFFSPYNYRVFAKSIDTVSNFSNEVTITVVGIKQITNNIPDAYELKQNYPNPFNPTTTIEYSIPLQKNIVVNERKQSNNNVTLKVYDVLGKEVVTLVNEFQKPGAYSVKFDADKLSSGIYYYQLKTYSFIATKKMLLLK